MKYEGGNLRPLLRLPPPPPPTPPKKATFKMSSLIRVNFCQVVPAEKKNKLFRKALIANSEKVSLGNSFFFLTTLKNVKPFMYLQFTSFVHGVRNASQTRFQNNINLVIITWFPTVIVLIRPSI